MSRQTSDVVVLGVGCTHFGDLFGVSAAELVAEAVSEALKDAGLERSQVEAGWIGTYFPHSGLAGTSLSDAVGLFGVPVSRVENYCVTGTDAIRHGAMAVASGWYDVVVVAGVEKLKERGDVGIPDQGEHDIIARGRSAPGGFALSATAYLAKYGLTTAVLDDVAVKNHANGSAHPKAHLRRRISKEQAAAAAEVSSPLRLYDCCPTSDGAAAVVLGRRELAPSDRPTVSLRGIALSSFASHPYLQPGFDYLSWPATVAAAKDAYRQAGIGPEEVDVAEVHDCFTITEILTVEDLGFAEPGEGWRLSSGGHTQFDGSKPVNPSGGLKAFGHPVGATGVRMAVEVVRQLQGRAEGLQVHEPRLGLTHNVGGPGGAIAGVAVWGRDDVLPSLAESLKR
jgi:acetyl-CoA C-acetyltransferase